MGYYTDFKLTVYHKDEFLAGKRSPILAEENSNAFLALKKEIERLNVFDTVFYDDGSCYCNNKWYDSSDDMCVLSRRFPGYAFELSGFGEEAEDIWKEYFIDGQHQLCRADIVYPPFDSAAMVPPASSRILSDPDYRYSYQIEEVEDDE